MTPRLKEIFNKEIQPALKDQFGFKNIYMAPRIEKVVLNMGLGLDATDSKILKSCEEDMAKITGQKPVTTKFKKSVANFKTRKGSNAGLKVTLRKNRMYEFLDRLVNIALPRIKDFRMAKLSAVNKNKKRIKLSDRLYKKRQALKKIVMDKKIPLEERFKAQQKLSKLPRNSAKIRVMNRCEITGRPHGVYRKLKISRIALRQLGLQGKIPGLVKSSW